MSVDRRLVIQHALLHCLVCAVFGSSPALDLADNVTCLAAVFAANHGELSLVIPLSLFSLFRSPWQTALSSPALLVVCWHATKANAKIGWLLKAVAVVCVGALFALTFSRDSLPLLDGSALLPYAVRTGSGPAPLSSSWYLFSSAFLRYMPYYTWLTWAHPLLYAAPLLVRFKHRPEVALIVQLALVALFDPSTCYSASRWVVPFTAAHVLCPDVVAGMKGVTLPTTLLAFSLVVIQVMKSLWLGPALLGNANFLFNHTVLAALCGGSLCAEFCLSAMRLKRLKQEKMAGQKD